MPTLKAALPLALRALTAEKAFSDAPRIPCAREFMPAFGLGEPFSSILRVGLGPL